MGRHRSPLWGARGMRRRGFLGLVVLFEALDLLANQWICHCVTLEPLWIQSPSQVIEQVSDDSQRPLEIYTADLFAVVLTSDAGARYLYKRHRVEHAPALQVEGDADRFRQLEFGWLGGLRTRPRAALVDTDDFHVAVRDSNAAASKRTRCR